MYGVQYAVKGIVFTKYFNSLEEAETFYEVIWRPVDWEPQILHKEPVLVFDFWSQTNFPFRYFVQKILMIFGENNNGKYIKSML